MFKQIEVRGRGFDGGDLRDWMDAGDQGFDTHGQPRRGRTVTVDELNGNDDIGERMGAPFATLAAALEVALSGDTIIVLPGDYEGNDLLKDGVNWYFFPGASVTYTNVLQSGSGTVRAMFDDHAGAVSSQIRGHGDFYFDYGAPGFDGDAAIAHASGLPVGGVLNINDEDSEIYFSANKIRGRSFFTSTVFVAVNITNCERCTIDVDEILDVGYGESVEIGIDSGGSPVVAPTNFGGVWWWIGETHLNARRIKTAKYCIYCSAPTDYTGSSNIWITGDRFENSTDNVVYLAGDSDTLNWKIWMNVKEILSTGSLAGGFNILGRMRLYVIAEKVGGLYGFDISSGSRSAEIWLNVQKVSYTQDGGTGGLVMRAGATNTTVYADIMQFEDARTATTTDTAMIEVNAGVLVITGLIATLQTNCRGILHKGGVSRIRGYHIDTDSANAAVNRPVEVSAAGCILDGLKLVAPALAESVYAGTAQDVTVYGPTFANRAKHANVTIRAGTFTVDTTYVV